MIPNNTLFRMLAIAFLGIVATAAYAQTAPSVTNARGVRPVAADDTLLVLSSEADPGGYQTGERPAVEHGDQTDGTRVSDTSVEPGDYVRGGCPFAAD